MFDVITEILDMFIKIIDVIIKITDKFTNNLLKRLYTLRIFKNKKS